MKHDLAFLFPGQGSQRKGMLEELIDHPVVSETLAEATEVLGYDVKCLVLEDPEGQLDQTEYTQPALLCLSIALLRLWRHRGGAEAGHVAGHSLGEYTALVAAGSLAFPTALSLVAFRGRQMASAVPEGEGAMAAVLGLSDAQVEALCKQVSGPDGTVWPANYNCPGQLVVAGIRGAVQRLVEAAREAGARKVVMLPVSVPSHTPLMAPAAEAMRERLSNVEIRRPDRMVWSNVDARCVSDPDEIRDALVRQLVSPVRWSEIVRNMAAAGVMAGIELGPGKVLAGLVRRIDRHFRVWVTEGKNDLDQALEDTQ